MSEEKTLSNEVALLEMEGKHLTRKAESRAVKVQAAFVRHFEDKHGRKMDGNDWVPIRCSLCDGSGLGRVNLVFADHRGECYGKGAHKIICPRCVGVGAMLDEADLLAVLLRSEGAR
jgi:DnaJ-class molecular chaperone